MKNAVLMFLALALMTSKIVRAQVPAGAITGFVTDATGARISGVSVTITNGQTGLKRAMVTSNVGTYSAAALLPGFYEVTADAAGFTRLARDARG